MISQRKKIVRSIFASPDWIGKRFGKRVIIGHGKNKGGNNHTWVMRCDCGDESEVISSYVATRNRSHHCARCSPGVAKGIKSKNWKGSANVPATAYGFFKASAEHRGIQWAITIDDVDALFVKQAGRCAFTGAQLRFRTGWQYKRYANASLDRIDSAKGYTPENIQLVTSDVNFAKQQLSNKEFIALCRAVANHSDETGEFDEVAA